MHLSQPLVLGSASPRRQFLLKEAGFDFRVEKPDIEESFSSTMDPFEVAKYLASLKAEHLLHRIHNEIILTADTVVILKNRILNKPMHRSEAIQMLSDLSGQQHMVVTGVCIRSQAHDIRFDDTTEVTFKKLSVQEIEYYVDHYAPYDKAGAYGAQDWIGMVAIHKIVGSYFNVMGLPIHLVYQHLSTFA